MNVQQQQQQLQQQQQQHSTLVDTFTHIKELLTYEIYRSLPKLETTETKHFIDLNKTAFASANRDKLFEFYDYIKKKYASHRQLAYFHPYALNHYFKLKKNFLSLKQLHNYSAFSFESMLYTFVVKDFDISHRDFVDAFTTSVESLHLTQLFSSNEWSIVEIDETFCDSYLSLTNYMNLLKYNPHFLDRKVHIRISTFYRRILNDLACMLKYHSKSVTHLIIEFLSETPYEPKAPEHESKKRFDFFMDDIVLNNSFIATLFEELVHFEYLEVLVVTCRFTKIFLEPSAGSLIAEVLKKRGSLSVFVFDNFIFDDEQQYEVIQAVYQSNNMKFLFLDGNKWLSDCLIAFKDHFNCEAAQLGKQLLIRFDKRFLFNNINISNASPGRGRRMSFEGNGNNKLKHTTTTLGKKKSTLKRNHKKTIGNTFLLRNLTIAKE